MATVALSPSKPGFVRFNALDTESLMDFAGGFKRLQREYAYYDTAAMRTRRDAFVASLGYDTGPTDISFEECHRILMEDPIYRAEIRLSRSIQELMWDRARRALYKDFDKHMDAMEAAEKRGPGSLELDGDLNVPQYARHEIHQQPGGYVGDPLSGVLYHYATTTAFNQGVIPGPVRHDEPFVELAASIPVPADGKVRRILDLGCGEGRFAIQLKKRFPDAEVWGLDVGAPMIRHAHCMAVAQNLDVNWIQGLAEDTGFPDNHFDIVAINLLFHEVPAEISAKIVPEIHRILRDGGVWVGDSANGYKPWPRSIVSKAATWVNHRYNTEPWEIEWYSTDFEMLATDAGFRVQKGAGEGFSDQGHSIKT